MKSGESRESEMLLWNEGRKQTPRQTWASSRTYADNSVVRNKSKLLHSSGRDNSLDLDCDP